MEVVSTRVRGNILIVEVRLSLNLLSLTLEQVLGKRRKAIKDLGANIALEVQNEIQANTGDVRLAEDAARITTQLMRDGPLREDKKNEHFNDDEAFIEEMRRSLRIKSTMSLDPTTMTAQNIRTLDINGTNAADSNAKLSTVPAWLVRFAPTLVSLDLSGCSNMTNLPDELRELHQLQVLNLGDCTGLVELPRWLGELTHLHTLRLYRCIGLRSLPETLTNIKKIGLTACENMNVAQVKRLLPHADLLNPPPDRAFVSAT